MHEKLNTCIYTLGLFDTIVYDNKKKKFFILDIPNKTVSGPK